MAKKEDFPYEIFPYLSSLFYYVSLFSMSYQATDVSLGLCVLQHMENVLIQINGYTHRQTDI